jgi:hypothetical protein
MELGVLMDSPWPGVALGGVGILDGILDGILAVGVAVSE